MPPDSYGTTNAARDLFRMPAPFLCQPLPLRSNGATAIHAGPMIMMMLMMWCKLFSKNQLKKTQPNPNPPKPPFGRRTGSNLSGLNAPPTHQDRTFEGPVRFGLMLRGHLPTCAILRIRRPRFAGRAERLGGAGRVGESPRAQTYG